MAPTTTKKEILCCIIALFIKKRLWYKDWLKKRNVDGIHATILYELRDGHKLDFRNYLRMSVNTFYMLLAKVEPHIVKKDTNMKDSITAEARLEATLRYLATGCTYSALQYSTRISKQSLSKIIPETCLAIYHVLKDDYLQVS